MKWKPLLVTVVLLATACAKSGVPVEKKASAPPPKNGEMRMFMGVKWGATMEEFDETFKQKENISERFDDSIFMINHTLGSATIETTGIYFAKCKTTKYCLANAGMDFVPTEYVAIASIFKEKYGEPDETINEEITNGFGAKFQQQVLKWTDNQCHREIVLAKYSGKVTKGAAVFQAIDPNAAIKKAAETKKAAGQL